MAKISFIQAFNLREITRMGCKDPKKAETFVLLDEASECFK